MSSSRCSEKNRKLTGRLVVCRLDRPLTILPLALMLLLLLPAGVGAELYSYEDRNGTLHFVDDPGKIPRQYRQQKRVITEQYDDLPAEERARLLDLDRRERDERREREDRLTGEQRRQQVERQRQQERLQVLATPVLISGRQVFVPVKLMHGDAVAEVMLLLDTGASVTTISPRVADQLGIGQTDYVRVGVAGGKVLRARTTTLTAMEVGPVKRTDMPVVVLRNLPGETGEGLLGMDFLGGLKYTIDFKRHQINWLP